jgi:hypothetical protein
VLSFDNLSYFKPKLNLTTLPKRLDVNFSKRLWMSSSISIVLTLQALACQAQNAPKHLVPSASLAPEVYFVNLNQGDQVRSPFRVIFGLSRMGLAPTGVDKPATGHHHLLINTPLPIDLTKPIPFSDKYLHFGGGQSETVLTLPKGKHTLQLLFADANHKPFVKTASGQSIVVFSKQITIEVVP